MCDGYVLAPASKGKLPQAPLQHPRRPIAGYQGHLQPGAGERYKQAAALASAEFGNVHLGDHHRVGGLALKANDRVHQPVMLPSEHCQAAAYFSRPARGSD